MCRSLTPGARAGRFAPSPLRGSPPCARLRFRLCALAPSGAAAGGVGLGLSLPPWARSRRAFRRSRRRGVGGSLRSLSAFVGVFRGSFRSVCFFGGAFRPRRVCAVVGFRAGRFVPLVVPRPVRVCRGRAVFLPGCRRAFRRFVGSPVAVGVSRLLRSRRAGWVRGLCSGCAAAGRGRSRSRLAGAGRPFLAGLFRRLVVSALSLFPAAASAVVGFSGGRRLSPAFRPRVSGVVSSVLAAGRSVAVGCAAGADSFVRAAAPGALVFPVSGSSRSAFAARSVALVRAVAAGGPGSGLVVFPAAPCPAGLLPSASASACFCGLGSGSWASAAFAAGLGLPLVVFPCGFSGLPPWGVWVPAGAGVWASGFRLVV